MADPADIRAEGRRLLAAVRDDLPDGEWEVAQEAWEEWVAPGTFPDALLADPAHEPAEQSSDFAVEQSANLAAPVGLTEDERELVEAMRAKAPQHPLGESLGLLRIIAIIDRLSAAPRAEREALERIARQGRRKPSDTGLNAVDLAMIARAALAALPVPEEGAGWWCTPDCGCPCGDEPAAAPVPEGVPEDHRVCSHGIYHHGCLSCDRQDPEERL